MSCREDTTDIKKQAHIRVKFRVVICMGMVERNECSRKIIEARILGES